MNTKIALVTGANRRMGRAISEKLASNKYHVVMVGRDETGLQKAVAELADNKYSAGFIVADISKEDDCTRLIKQMTDKHGRLDVLINNAGIFIDESKECADLSFKETVMKQTMETNAMAPYRLMKGLIPLMRKNGYGRVVNVSSGLGSFDGAASYCLSYCVSKATLNMLTKLFASEVDGTKIKVNAICPGWVQTDMGGKGAPRTIEQGISGMYWAATLDESGPNGGFFRDGTPISW